MERPPISGVKGGAPAESKGRDPGGVRDKAPEAENILYTFIQTGPKVKGSVVRVYICIFCDYYVQTSASPYFGSLGRGPLGPPMPGSASAGIHSKETK